MTLLGLSDGDEAAYTDIAEAIRIYSHAPATDLHELWRRIVFNVMVSNLDDHLRNHSFLYDRDDKWRLSPAYDLNPAPLADKARELTTWIPEKGQARTSILPATQHHISRSTWFGPTPSSMKSRRHWTDEEHRTKIGMSASDLVVYATAIRNTA